MTLGEIAERLVENKKQKTDLKRREDELAKQNGQLIRQALELMEQSGVESFDVGDVGKITEKMDVNCKVVNSKDFFKYLEEKGDDSIAKIHIAPSLLTDELKEIFNTAASDDIKLSVHAGTLKAYIKGECDPLDSETWPPGVDVGFYRTVNVTVKK